MVERALPGAAAGLATTLALALLLAGCASGPRGGRDGPGDKSASDVANLPDAQPRIESVRSSGGTSKPYTVLGRSYTPITDDRRFTESGLASWYGRKFHAQSTASGEAYDMYAMTAAHKTLPLPSYVRVRNPANGREAIVRVNDRGPFVDGRVIDLSYAAAARLDLLRGVAPVEIERITNDDIRTGAWKRDGGTAYAAASGSTGAVAPAGLAMTSAVAGSAAVAPPPPPALRSPDVAAFATPAGAAAVPDDSARLAVAPASVAAAQVEVPSQWAKPVSSGPPEGDPAPAAPIRYVETRSLGYLGASNEPSPGSPTAASAALPSARDSAGNAGVSAAAPPPENEAGARDNPAGTTRGYWVQLGAFRDRAGAQDLLSRAARGVPEYAGQMRVFDEAGTNRLQAGPFATRNQAGEAMARLREGTGIAAIIVERN